MGDVYAQPTLLAGAKSPEKLRLTIVAGQIGIDLRTVSTVTLLVKRADEQQTWLTSIVQQQRDRLIVQHVFDVDGFETRMPGRYQVQPVLTLQAGAGVRRACPFILPVIA